MDNEGSLAAADWFAELLDTQPFLAGDADFVLENFGAQRTAMIVTGSWSLPRLREMGVPFRVNSFPHEYQPSQPFLTVYGFLISRSTLSPDQAQNLLWNYLSSYEAVNAYATVLGAAPARRDVLENFPDAELRAFGLAGEFRRASSEHPCNGRGVESLDGCHPLDHRWLSPRPGSLYYRRGPDPPEHKSIREGRTMPIDVNLLNEPINRCIRILADHPVGEALHELQLAGGESWWHLVVDMGDGRFAAVQFRQLIPLAESEGFRFFDRPLSSLVELGIPLAPVVEQAEIGTEAAKDLADESPHRVLVITQAGQFLGIVYRGEAAGTDDGASLFSLFEQYVAEIRSHTAGRGAA